MRKLLACSLLLTLYGCGGGGSNSGNLGFSSPPFNNPAPSPSQSSSPSPTPTVTPDPPKSAIRLQLSLVLPRVVDVVISSFRLSLYRGPGNPGTLVAGPFSVARAAGSAQNIDWPNLPVGTYTFYLELLDSDGNLRGTFSRTVELTDGQTVAISDPEWTDATQPAPQTNPLPPGAEPTRKSTAGTFGQMVLDTARQRLYFGNSGSQQVEVYDLGSQTLLAPIPCGSRPLGMDLSADGRYLVVCPEGEAKMQMLDLSADPPAIINLAMPDATRGTNRPRNVACASNGKAVFGCVFSGSGWTDLWELNLATRQIVRRADQADVHDPLYLKASGDRKFIALAEGNISSGPSFLYQAESNTYTSRKVTQNFQRFAAANNTGERFMFSSDYFDRQLRRRAATSEPMVDFAFNQSNRFGFGAPYNQSRIDWLDTQRNQLIRSFSLPATPRQVVSTPDGRRFFAMTSSGLEDVQLPANFPPQVEALGPLAVPLKGDGSITLQAFDPEGDQVHFDALTLPNGAQLDSTTGVLRYRPSGGQAGTTSQAVVSVNDGTNSTTLTVPLQILPEASVATLLPIDGELRELFYDAGSGQLLVTNRSKNRVERIRVQDSTVLAPIPVLSHPQGLDRVGTSGPLLVCGNSGEFVDVVDLDSLSVNRSLFVPADAGDNDRPYSVAATSSGRVLVGLDSAGTGFTIPREVNLSGDVVTRRTDLGNLSEPVVVRPSGDRSRVAVIETNSSGSDGFLLDTGLANRQVLFTNRSAPRDTAGNTDGSRWLVGAGPSLFSPGNVNLGNITPTQQFFTWMGALGYGHAGTGVVNQLNLTTFSTTPLFTLPAVATGGMALSTDQTRLFVISQGGLCLVRL